MKLVDRISHVNDKIDSALKQCNRSDGVTIVAATKTRNTKAIETCVKNGIVAVSYTHLRAHET